MPDSSTPSARRQRGWRPTKSFWIGAATVLLLVLSAAASGGFGSVLLPLSAVALFTGLYALLLKSAGLGWALPTAGAPRLYRAGRRRVVPCPAAPATDALRQSPGRPLGSRELFEDPLE